MEAQIAGFRKFKRVMNAVLDNEIGDDPVLANAVGRSFGRIMREFVVEAVGQKETVH
jgi:hypothetical protein